MQASWRQTVLLAFQSIGVVYGDLGTSPLYTYSGTFPGGIRHPDDILGVLSLILYTLILLPLLKYVFIVLYANDNGDGEHHHLVLYIIFFLCLFMDMHAIVLTVNGVCRGHVRALLAHLAVRQDQDDP